MNLYQRMTQTLALNMGDAILVREQFEEAIVRVSELEAEAKKWKQITCDWQDTNSELEKRISELEKELEATKQNADHWMDRKEEYVRENENLYEDNALIHGQLNNMEKALSESERISKSWKAQWEAMLQDERKEKALRCSLQDSLSDIKDACSFNNTVMVEYYSRREKFLVRLIQQCYEIAAEAVKK